MELSRVQDIFAAVDKVSSVAERMRDTALAKELDEVAGTLFGLAGAVQANVAAKLLELPPKDIANLGDRGVLDRGKQGFEPRRLHEALGLARDLRAESRHLDTIRWWLDDRALLADGHLQQGLAKPGDDVLTPHAQHQVDGLDRRTGERFEAWKDVFAKEGVKKTDYRVTGISQRVCVKELDTLRVVVVAPPKTKRAVVLLVVPQTDTYGYVHLLGKSKPKSKRTKPRAGDGEKMPGWTSGLEALAERVEALRARR